MHEKLDVGDYMTSHDAKISVDRKQNLQEVCYNLVQEKKRFEAECERARSAGIKLVILVEHGGIITSLERVKEWKNPRLMTSPYAVSGVRLQYMMAVLAAKYGIEWEFCQKRFTANRIISILRRG